MVQGKLVSHMGLAGHLLLYPWENRWTASPWRAPPRAQPCQPRESQSRLWTSETGHSCISVGGVLAGVVEAVLPLLSPPAKTLSESRAGRPGAVL